MIHNEMEFQLGDGRMVCFDVKYNIHSYHYGSDADGRRGESRTEREDTVSNVFVEGVEISQLHPADQAGVNEEIEKYLSKWVANE